MNRRKFLMTVGTATGLAGCIGGGRDSTPKGTATSEPTPGSIPESTPEATPEQSTDSTPEPTAESSPTPSLTIQNQSLSAADTPFHNAYAEAVIENNGSARCGPIELTSRWFDDSDSFIGEETVVLPTLGAGERWIARVGTSKEREEIDDFELSGEYEVSPGPTVAGLSIVDDSLNVEDEYSGTIRAEVENTRDESLFMASFYGVIYDNNGRAIAGREDRESDISPGENLFFETTISTTRSAHRITKAANHMVLVTSSEDSETRQI